MIENTTLKSKATFETWLKKYINKKKISLVTKKKEFWTAINYPVLFYLFYTPFKIQSPAVKGILFNVDCFCCTMIVSCEVSLKNTIIIRQTKLVEFIHTCMD